MPLPRFISRALTIVLAAGMLFQAVAVPTAQAKLMSTEDVVASARADSDRVAVQSFLSRSDVRDQMRTLGVSPEEAEARVAAMSDAEVARLAAALPQEPAGQDAVGALVGAALIVFIVLLITDLVGVTDVFPFVRSAR